MLYWRLGLVRRGLILAQGAIRIAREHGQLRPAERRDRHDRHQPHVLHRAQTGDFAALDLSLLQEFGHRGDELLVPIEHEEETAGAQLFDLHANLRGARPGNPPSGSGRRTETRHDGTGGMSVILR